MSSDALNAIDADATALTSASMLAEEALALHHDAVALLAEGWSSESACAADDLLRQQIVVGAELVAALHEAAAEFRSLRGVIEESGSVPDMGQTAARLNERPTPSLQAPAPQPSYAGPAAWPSSVPSISPLPDLAGALVGLVATAADALSPDSVDPPGGPPDDVPVGPPADSPDEKAGPTLRATVVGEPVTPSPATPAAVPPTPALPDWPQPRPRPEPPLLAAERPAEPDPTPAPEPTPVPPQLPAEPAPTRSPAESNPSTPCEIAADELPQVGR